MARHGYVLIPPFDDRAVIAGQGTVGLEIAADCPQVGLVLVPVSGGGLISGIAAAVRAVCPAAAVVGVEPELAADARESFRRGERVSWPSADVQRTVADALRVEQVGALPFAHIRELVAGMVTVTEDEMLAAVRLLASQARLVAEPGGAAAVAAWLYHRDELPGGHHAGSGGLGRQHRPGAAGGHPDRELARPGAYRLAATAQAHRTLLCWDRYACHTRLHLSADRAARRLGGPAVPGRRPGPAAARARVRGERDSQLRPALQAARHHVGSAADAPQERAVPGPPGSAPGSRKAPAPKTRTERWRICAGGSVL